VSTMSPADAWQRTGMPSDRSYPSGPSPRFDRDREGYVPRSPRSAPPPPRSRAAAADRDRDRSADRMRAPERRSAGEAEYRRTAARRPEAPRSRSNHDYDAPPVRRPADRRSAAGGPPRGEQRTETGGSRLRGIVAVVAVFLVTLAACGVESFLGSGLGTVTAVALIGSAALAALLVRRRDLISVVVAPPLVFVAVALIDVAAAPSASFSLTTLATLLIRGFPAMGISTGIALVIALIRAAAKR
jgi:hypothetical protein